MKEHPTTQISFRGLKPSESAEREIQARINELTTFAPNIISCRVMVEVPHKHHAQGNQYHVRITAHVPGDEVVVTHQPTLHAAERHLGADRHHKATELEAADRNLYKTIHEAFDLARRQLQDHVRRDRGKVKSHEGRATRTD